MDRKQHGTRRRTWLIPVLGLSLVAGAAAPFAAVTPASAAVPKPSPYPLSWELRFEHGKPERIVVNVPGKGPRAYWYLTYQVVNEGEEDVNFLPLFEMVTEDGKVRRSDRAIPLSVFRAIKARERNDLLEPRNTITGKILPGVDQARDGVAIWEEPMEEMGQFQIFVGGLSGEFVEMKDEKGEQLKGRDGEPVILRKSLQLTYHINGDEVYPGEDRVNVGENQIGANAETWVMR